MSSAQTVPCKLIPQAWLPTPVMALPIDLCCGVGEMSSRECGGLRSPGALPCQLLACPVLPRRCGTSLPSIIASYFSARQLLSSETQRSLWPPGHHAWPGHGMAAPGSALGPITVPRRRDACVPALA